MTLRRTPVLLVCLLTVLCAAAQTSTSQDIDYAARARQVVENELRKSGEPMQRFRIEIAGGPSPTDHIRLHRPGVAPPGRASLAGRIVNEKWDAVAGMRLSLTPTDNSRATISIVTSSSGEFQIADVAPGAYQALFESGAVSRQLTIASGTHRILAPLSDRFAPYFLFSSAGAPAARVFLTTYREDRLIRFDTVEFDGPNARIRESVSESLQRGDAPGLETPVFLSGSEQKELSTEMDRLLTTLFDVTRGPDRFKPLLSSRVVCRIYYSGERRIASIDNSRCAMNLLDSAGLAAWYQLETKVDNPGRLVFDWYDEPSGTPDEQRMSTALKKHEVLRNELRDAAMFEAEHSRVAQQYLRSSAPPIMKATVEDVDPALPLPKGDLYILHSQIPILLVREGNELRVVCVFMAGG